MTLKLPGYVQFIINRLEAAGYEAYAVGGCVRDLLLGASPGDYDITTSARPEQIKSLFEKTVDTGIKHGTVTVIRDGTPCEVTTFRTESGYGDHRHPEKVTFVSSIKEDLMRRDFTVNAMAYNECRGLIDYFGGRDDLKAKILRTVGDPGERFGEDALRILRLFRFASVLDFNMESATLNSALSLAESLKNVSAERISAELKKAVYGQNVTALSPLINRGGLEFICIDRDRLSQVQKLYGNARFFAFIYLCGGSPEATAAALKLSVKERRYIEKMSGLVSLSPKADPREIKRALRDFEEVFGDYLDYAAAVEDRDVTEIKKIYGDIIAKGEPYKISLLAVNGDDLAKCGFRGKEVGRVLETLLKKVTDDPTLNTREKLLTLAKNS